MIRTVVYISAFLTGLVVMAFEMLIGHYLNPFFGSSIMTWGAIISTVLVSLTIGYFWGGRLADRFPSGKLIGGLLCLSALYLFALPLVKEPLLLRIATSVEDPRFGALLSAVLFAVPLMPLGMYCPFAIRLTITDRANSGADSGIVYGISTIGSIVGTLSVAFYLVLFMGTRNITLLLAGVALVAGVLNLTLVTRKTEGPVG